MKLIYFVLTVHLLSGCVGLVIRELHVPALVEPFTDSIILDCKYDLEDSSLLFSDAGLVIKWFLNGESNMVYQWIPPNPPQGHGVLKHKLNLTFTITNQPYTKHRALNILRPTANLTGEYTCQVSTLYHNKDATRSALMTVHSLPSDLYLYYHHPYPFTANVSCVVIGVNPKPSIKLYFREGNNGTKHKLGEIQEHSVWTENGLHVTAWGVLNDIEIGMPPVIEFICQVSLLQYSYLERLKQVYFPGKTTTSTSPSSFNSKWNIHDMSSCCCSVLSWQCLLFSMVLVLIRLKSLH